MGLGADLAKTVFGHRTHVARHFGTPEGFKRAEGHMVANTSDTKSAESGWPTGSAQPS